MNNKGQRKVIISFEEVHFLKLIKQNFLTAGEICSPSRREFCFHFPTQSTELCSPNLGIYTEPY